MKNDRPLNQTMITIQCPKQTELKWRYNHVLPWQPTINSFQTMQTRFRKLTFISSLHDVYKCHKSLSDAFKIATVHLRLFTHPRQYRACVLKTLKSL